MAPTWDVPVLFFSSDYNLTLIEPLFLQSKLLKLLAKEAKSGQRKLVQKGPPFIFYFFTVTYKTGRD